MKKNKLLVGLLMAVLWTGLSSCEEDKLNYIDEIYLNYGISDYKNIEMRSHIVDEKKSDTTKMLQISFSGLRNNHLWIASFDYDSKKKLMEWTDTKEFERKRKKYLGYGEYRDAIIHQIRLEQIYLNSNNFIAQFQLMDIEGPCTTTNFIEKLHIFKTPTNIKELSNIGEVIVKWYKESVFIHNCCYSNEGDTIYLASRAPSSLDAELISYEEGIKTEISYKSINISKYNYKDARDVWSTPITPPFDVPIHTKINYTLLDKSTNVWKYRVNYIFYDGTKKDYTFAINTNNGNLQ